MDGLRAYKALGVHDESPSAISEFESIDGVSHKIIDSLKVRNGVVGICKRIAWTGCMARVFGESWVSNGGIDTRHNLFGNLSLSFAWMIHGEEAYELEEEI